MDIQAFLETKRDGHAHDEASLRTFVDAVAQRSVPDEQVAAWLMATCIRGMTEDETFVLADAMARSGDVVDLSGFAHAVDKHSTGGVGDKTTLVLAPLLASLGATVAKMSGRGLGHTGGTIDKLESIRGFDATLGTDAFMRTAREVGVVVTAATDRLAPADAVLYALRNATATVPSLPLIASSIMSKKLAGGATSMVLDVKVGRGAFMPDMASARALGLAMREIGRRAGRRVAIVWTRMDAPLGSAVGNAVEVLEAMDTLRGEGPRDLVDVTVVLAQQVLAATGLAHDRETIETALHDGRAWTRFERWIAAQGGDLDDPASLRLAPDHHELCASHDGTVTGIDALAVGRAVRCLGGGRASKADTVDPGVGAHLLVREGDSIRAGTPWIRLLHRNGHGLDAATTALLDACTVSETGSSVEPVVLDVLAADA